MSAIPKSSSTSDPKRGEVWRVQLEPTRGSEQGKTRPIVVLTEPPVGRATMRLCVPVVHVKTEHGRFFWCIALAPDASNGLSKDSTADVAQTRALDVVRFETRLGMLVPDELELIAAALARCVQKPLAPRGTTS